MGFNDVHPILEHCVISENWKGSRGGEGKSYNFYDTNVMKWRQLFEASTHGGKTWKSTFDGRYVRRK